MEGENQVDVETKWNEGVNSRKIWETILVKKDIVSILELNELRKNILQFFLEKYSDDSRIKEAKVFWSTASKNYTKNSDVDLLLIIKDWYIDWFKNEILNYLECNNKYLWKWAYSENHYYIVHDFLVPLDLYIVSESESNDILEKKDKNESLFHILQKEKGITTIINNDNIKPIQQTDIGENDSFMENKEYDVNYDNLSRLITRVYRLTSKINQEEYIQSVFIIDSIRNVNIFPLLSLLEHNFINTKMIDLSEIDNIILDDFIQSFPQPTKKSILNAMKKLLNIWDVLINAYVEKNWDNYKINQLKKWLAYTKQEVDMF